MSAEQATTEDTAQSSVRDLLSCFRRYRRGCQQHPSNDWADNIYEQWRADRKFYQEAYSSKRHIDFGKAAEFAQEQLFIRCHKR